MIALYVVIAIVVVLITFFIANYNVLVRLRNQRKNAWAQIDVQLKRRYDLIPNLMETVRGYMKHERETMEAVTKARNLAQGASSGDVGARSKAEGELSSALARLMVVVENYPDLKANQNFLQLQDELTHTEDKIAYARQHFNDSVLSYNNTIETFPGVIFARRMGKKEREMLQIPEESKELPKVSF